MGAFELQKHLLLFKGLNKKGKNNNEPVLNVGHVLAGYMVQSMVNGPGFGINLLLFCVSGGMQ